MACAFLAALAACCLRAEEPHSEPPTTSTASPRELLELFDIGPTFFAGFSDERPLIGSEREKLQLLLYRLRQIPPGTMNEFAHSARGLPAVREHPSEYRGDVFFVPGVVQYVTREQLDPELREKFQFDACYRCQIATMLGGNVTLYAASIPRAWKLNEPLQEQCGAAAMFVKVLSAGSDDDRKDDDSRSAGASLLFVAPRVAWYPNNLLSRLRMDSGLLDDVSDRGELDERECFYQMLAAVRRATGSRIERAGRSQLAERRDLNERIARNAHQSAKDRAAARRALERAEHDADDVVPLFNEPAKQRGKLFALRGEALRAIEIRVDDPDIVKRFGIDHYYEVEIVTADSQNNPIVCCVAQLPADMPLGESIHENVSVTGFFLKSWAFDGQKSSVSGTSTNAPKRQQLAPLIIAKTVQVLGSPRPESQSPILAIGVVVAILVGAVVAWRVRRGDRRALARAAGTASSLPPRIEIEDPPPAPPESA